MILPILIGAYAFALLVVVPLGFWFTGRIDG